MASVSCLEGWSKYFWIKFKTAMTHTMSAPSPNQICAYRLSITMKFFQCVTIHLYTSKTWIRVLCVSVGHVWFYACSSIWLSIQSSSSCYLLIISFKSGKRLEIVCSFPSAYFQAFLKYSSSTFKSSLANHVLECYPCFQWPFTQHWFVPHFSTVLISTSSMASCWWFSCYLKWKPKGEWPCWRLTLHVNFLM